MKINFLISILLISIILAVSIVSANVPQQVCKVPQGSVQSPQGSPVPVVSNIQNPVKLSSLTAGYKDTACGVATFGAAIQRSEVLDSSGTLLSQPSIINICAVAGALSPTNGGTFDQYLSATKTTINADPTNCYLITVKRLNSYTDLPVLTLPNPIIETIKNLKVITYKPYNFRQTDIISAMQSVTNGKGAVGLGGVSYDSSNNVKAAHMFQPLGMNPNPRTLPSGQIRYDMKIYDPYFDAEKNVEVSFDQQGRIYSNIWGNDWFHLEELFLIQNLGPCANVNQTIFQSNSTSSTGASGGPSGKKYKGSSDSLPRPQRSTSSLPGPTGPITPQGCGVKAGGVCQVSGACPNNEYCSFSSHCTCKSAFCGDGEKAPSEQCDDGNAADGDGCSASCQIENNCAGVPASISAGTCNNPGGQCMYDGSFGITMGVCNAQCKCVWQEPI